MKRSTPLVSSSPAAPAEAISPSPDAPPAARTGRLTPKYSGIGPERGTKAAPPRSPQETSSLGSLEAEIMGLLWEIGRPATGMDVMEVSLYKRRRGGQEPISFASIATTLRRLADKGLLRMEKGTARAPLYTPTMEREQMAARILNNVSVTLLGQTLHSLLPDLVGAASVHEHKPTYDDTGKVARLLKALKEVADSYPATEPGVPQ